MSSTYNAFQIWERNKPSNYFDTDLNLQRQLQIYLDADDSGWDAFSAMGALSASELNALAVESNLDENLPVLRRFDSYGKQIEEVIFHPSYHEFGKRLWRSGILSVLEDPGNWMHAGTLLYLAAHNGEAGHLCPVACTAGAIRLIQQLGTTKQKEQYLPRLLERDYSQRIHASQFLTEIQGGSDVGANKTFAETVENNPALFRITGEKWFCSVADAQLFVATARFPNGGQGTKGLGLFLIPRKIGEEVNGYAIRKLKYKLGTRSMATGEIDFTGAIGEPIGPLEQGFNNAVRIVLDTSRMYNSVVACGMMRRAFIEAQTYSRNRTAFGQLIGDYPLVQEKIARMKVDTCAAISSTFRILNQSDIIDRSNDPNLAAARRINVTINKYWTSLKCTETIHNAIEILGGNGTIEDFSVLPRLYRDSIVLESWEGSHNVLCLQVLRDFIQRSMHEPWIAELQSALSKLSSTSEHVKRAHLLCQEVARQIKQVLSMDGGSASFEIRRLVDRMCVVQSYINLVCELDFELKRFNDDSKSRIVDLYRLFYVDPDPDSNAIKELIRHESVTL